MPQYNVDQLEQSVKETNELQFFVEINMGSRTLMKLTLSIIAYLCFLFDLSGRLGRV